MRKFTYTTASAMLFLAMSLTGQNFSTVTVTGYNQDGVAESNPATGSTSTALDASGYVLYNVTYGTLYGTGTGLPNAGTVVSSGRTYQMQPYTGNNLVYVPNGFKDSVILTTPTPYAAISFMAFSTDGSSYPDYKVVYTDGTDETFSSMWTPDWFWNPNPVISGFDRASRASGTPDYNTSQPSMYPIDFYLSCSNQSKSVARIVIDNSNGGGNVCIFAVSAATPMSFNISGTNLTCNGAGNGAVTVTPTGGVAPFNYSWSAVPSATAATISGLNAGTYSVTVEDYTGCIDSTFYTITEPAPVAINVTASNNNVCAGTPITLSTLGASTFTWSTGANFNMTTVTPSSTTSYTVKGTTSNTCTVQGTITVTIKPLPNINFVVNPTLFCHNSPNILLNATPTGGAYSGAGIYGSSNLFNPVAAGIGTHTLTYSYTDATTNCTGVQNVPIVVQFCTGVEELRGGNISLYPNPANDHIAFASTEIESADLMIMDVTGKMLMQLRMKAGEPATITELVPGIYFYTILDQGATLGHGKFIKE